MVLYQHASADTKIPLLYIPRIPNHNYGHHAYFRETKTMSMQSNIERTFAWSKIYYHNYFTSFEKEFFIKKIWEVFLYYQLVEKSRSNYE